MSTMSDLFVRILKTGIAFMIVGFAGLLLTLTNLDRWRAAPGSSCQSAFYSSGHVACR